jgi:hypothetical protein
MRLVGLKKMGHIQKVVLGELLIRGGPIPSKQLFRAMKEKLPVRYRNITVQYVVFRKSLQRLIKRG